MSSDPTAKAQKPQGFSTLWVFLSIFVFLVLELFIGRWLAPLIASAYVSPMWHFEVQLLLHLVAFGLGGLVVGVISPGRRLAEPAVGAAVSVLLVFGLSFFLPTSFMTFDLGKVLVATAISFFVALFGAWQGERFMGNLGPDDVGHERSTRGRLRHTLWSEDEGVLTRRLHNRE